MTAKEKAALMAEKKRLGAIAKRAYQLAQAAKNKRLEAIEKRAYQLAQAAKNPSQRHEDNPFDDVTVAERMPAIARKYPLPWSVETDETGVYIMDADGTEILSSTDHDDYEVYMMIVKRMGIAQWLLDPTIEQQQPTYYRNES